MIVDVVVVVVVVLVVLLFAGVLARQRFMLRGVGGIPLALRTETPATKRWLYGVAQYHGDELRWYRAMGVGSKPNRTLLRAEIEVVGQRAPRADEVSALPASATVVEVRDPAGTVSLGFGEGAVTGFLSWLEASAPRW
ncbi:DUF2550 domain-containing protein [Jatrophihabitans sp. YIM 134969]